MLPAVTRPEPPSTGAGRTMLTVWHDCQRSTLLRRCALLEGAVRARRGVAPSSRGLLGPVPRMTVVEWDRCAPVVAGTSSSSPISVDDLQVPAAMADVELCMRYEPMSLRWTRIDRHADLAGEDIDGSVGG
jgi:hypothetical protein